MTEAERRLQDEVREFLAEHVPRHLPHALDERIEALRRWQGRCYEAGYVGRAWPREFGGGGNTAVEQIIVDQELAAAGAPEFVERRRPRRARPFAPALRQRRAASAATSRRSCRRRRSGVRASPSPTPDRTSRRCAPARSNTTTTSSSAVRRHGCPGASSRAGAGSSRGPRTSAADRPRHKGISMLIVDMSSPGVEVRPMTQITGHAEFCELFLDDVVVPKENLLSERGDGWKIAMYTLGHERGTAALPASGQAAHVARPAGRRRRPSASLTARR